MKCSRSYGNDTLVRERLVIEKKPTSIYWDPIRDRNVAFEIVDIRGFKKLGRTGYYLVQYKPRILDADDEFGLELPEVRLVKECKTGLREDANFELLESDLRQK
jgi:hypothetical protein